MSETFTPPPAAGANAPVGNNMVLAIVSAVVSFCCCCLPHGLLAVFFATQVNNKAAAGDLQGAADSAKKAKMFAWISIIVSVVWIIVAFFLGFLSAILSSVR
ncbi:MAG TPA: CD225/dispanin family protein [Pyrinomonadaceae bacterium]|jgi:hypothetical protein|nr:CD225/dispanin family protein [Pyrinomonadaceae bacterium]